MEKPYDLKALGEKLKAKGLPVAEAALEKTAAETYVAVKEWLTESAVQSENKIDDVVVAFLGQADAAVADIIKGIDIDGDGA